MLENEYNTPSKNGSNDSLEDGLLSLKLSNKKASVTETKPRTRTNSKTDVVGRKQSLSPKKSMRFNIATNAISRDFDEVPERENEALKSDDASNVSAHADKPQDYCSPSKEGNKLVFKQPGSNDMENLFLELAKRQRLVSELQLQLTEAEKKLKEWEQYCQSVMNGSGNNNLKTKKSGGESKAELNINMGEPSSSDVFNRWTSKLKATTDELLALAHTSTAESTTREGAGEGSRKQEENKHTPVQPAAGFLQASFGKFTDILQEFYEDEDDEKDSQKANEKADEEEKEGGADHKTSHVDAGSGNLFDKLKNKLSEFAVYNEEEEREFDKSRHRTTRRDSMNIELLDHSGVSMYGISSFDASVSGREQK